MTWMEFLETEEIDDPLFIMDETQVDEIIETGSVTIESADGRKFVISIHVDKIA